MKKQIKIILFCMILLVFSIFVYATPSTDPADYIWYETFESGSFNSTLFPTASNVVINTTDSYEGTKSAQAVANADAELGYNGASTDYKNITIQYWIYTTGYTSCTRGTSLYGRWGDGSLTWYLPVDIPTSSTHFIDFDGHAWGVTSASFSGGNWYKITWTLDTANSDVYYYVDDVMADNLSSAGYSTSVGNNLRKFITSNGNACPYLRDLYVAWNGVKSDEPQGAVVNVEIVNATYNFTSGITANDQNNWTTGTKDRVETYDTTPTVKFNTTIESVCAIGINDGNITNLTAGTGNYCAERDSYSHTCTYSTALSYTNHSLYVSCAVNNSGVWEQQLYVNQSTSRELPISIEVETLAVNLMSPENDNITTDTTPTFEFNLSTTLTTNFTCDLYINNTPYGDSNSSLCYQEFANVSTSCGGLATGIYNCLGDWDATQICALSYDGVLITYGSYIPPPDGNASLFINYSKPINALSSSLWQVKVSNPGVELFTNISIPTNCWNQDILQFKIVSYYFTATGGVNGSCWDGSNWIELFDNLGSGYAYSEVYEEAMWWNMPIKNGSIETITANESLSPGNYTWYVNCTDGTNVNQSDTRGIKILSPPDTNFSIWDGSNWIDAYLDYLYFRCLPDQTDCDSTNEKTNYSEMCYQEFANVATGCGGLDTGSYYGIVGTWDVAYPPALAYDGDWDTVSMCAVGSDNCYIYINYTKTENAKSNSKWMKKDADGIINLTIPQVCWDYYSDELIFRMHSDALAPGHTIWECFDGSWNELYDDYGTRGLYEEAMWWNITYDSVYRVCNNGTAVGVSNITMTINNTDFTDTDKQIIKCGQTLATSTPLALTEKRVWNGSLAIDGCEYFNCWADYGPNPTGGYFGIDAYVN